VNSVTVTNGALPDLRRLEAFLVLAEELHFRRAATRLHMAQSPLSRTIRKLEAELAVELFERSRSSVKLTPAGARLLPAARALVRQARQIVWDVRSA